MRWETMKAVGFHSLHMLVATFLASLLALALTHTAPVAAQEASTETGNEDRSLTKNQYASPEEPEQSVEQSGQQAPVSGDENTQTVARASDPLSREIAELINIGGRGDIVDRIEVEGADCTGPDVGATLTVRDGEDTVVTINNTGENTFEANDEQIIITRLNGGDIMAEGIEDLEAGNGTVVSSTGITCGRDADSNSVGADDNDANEDEARTADELLDLSCEELLVLFRAGSSSSTQYGDAAALANSDVQARIEVCLREEIVEGTAADGDLPDTGGVSLLGLAVLGLVSAGAGFSVIRGGGRRG